jgi:hypothetical protein
MSSNASGGDRHAKTVRAWQLAILRFAVTLDDADRLVVLAIAAEIDGLGPQFGSKPEFRFFRKTSAELCAAISRPNELTATVLRQYLARTDDERLKRIFAAAIEAGRPKLPSAGKPVKRVNGLWKGLSSRSSHPL